MYKRQQRTVEKANTPLILVMQRVHELDPTGWLLSIAKPDRVRHICLPAEVSDLVSPPELRKYYENGGGLLDPKRLSREVMEEKRTVLGSLGYAGQYEQNPHTPGGNIIREDWFQFINPEEFALLRSNQPIVFFGDTAYTADKANDPSGFIATCKIGQNLYITHAAWVRKEFPDLVRWLPDYVRSQGYTCLLYTSPSPRD